MTAVFVLFLDAPHRRRALAAERGSAERYRLYGMDQFEDRGFAVRHNLEAPGAPPRWTRHAGSVLKRALERAGGYGGDFATVLASRRELNRADVVFSTVDTVGIPLMLLTRSGLVRRPFVYTAIGLPERLAQLRSRRMRRLYARALASSAAVIAYSEHEAAELRGWLEGEGFRTRVEFVPFGVDVDEFVPPAGAPEVDVVSVGADPQRDFELLAEVARRMPDRRFLVVATSERASSLEPPENLDVEADLSFAEMRRRLEQARVVALPVRENSYSGATTVLLQAMALGKPVVVTRTQAIATGYGLVDGENCRLVPPGDVEAFARALAAVLQDEWHARALGASARSTIERGLGWDRYVERIAAIIRDAAGAQPDARSETA